jgi:hypothetical protein
MNRAFCVLSLVLVTLTACQLPQLNLFKKITHHPAPELQMDNSYFAGLGCFDSPKCLPDELQKISHPIGYISEPGNILGGLSPTIPLAVASTRGFTPEEEIPAVYVNRCMAQQYIRYLVNYEGEIRLIDSVEGLAALYAPIDSPDEALSYAIASTGFSAVNDLQNFPKPKIYADSVEETFVTSTAEGYVVHLFDTYLCGCGPHIVSSVDVKVRKDGSISLSEPVKSFSDPKMDGLCID